MQRAEMRVRQMAWKVRYDEITFINTAKQVVVHFSCSPISRIVKLDFKIDPNKLKFRFCAYTVYIWKSFSAKLFSYLLQQSSRLCLYAIVVSAFECTIHQCSRKYRSWFCSPCASMLKTRKTLNQTIFFFLSPLRDAKAGYWCLLSVVYLCL